jgi:hypothetical protein
MNSDYVLIWKELVVACLKVIIKTLKPVKLNRLEPGTSE